MAHSVRADVLIYPTAVVGGLTVLATPSAGTRWKINTLVISNTGTLQISFKFRHGPTTATRQVFWQTDDLNPNETAVFPGDEVVLRSTDSVSVEIPLLRDATVAAYGFVLQLP